MGLQVIWDAMTLWWRHCNDKRPCLVRFHWNGNVAILTKISSPASLEVVFLTSSSASSDENFIKMTTVPFRFFMALTSWGMVATYCLDFPKPISVFAVQNSNISTPPKKMSMKVSSVKWPPSTCSGFMMLIMYTVGTKLSKSPVIYRGVLVWLTFRPSQSGQYKSSERNLNKMAGGSRRTFYAYIHMRCTTLLNSQLSCKRTFFFRDSAR